MSKKRDRVDPQSWQALFDRFLERQEQLGDISSIISGGVVVI